jgi:hypothetical protein
LTGPASFKFENSTCQENHSFFQELLWGNVNAQW